MYKVLATVIVVSSFAVLSTALAADTEKMYLSKSNGKTMVMGGMNSEGSELMTGEAGKKPANCPAGSYYTTDASQQMVMACADDSKFSVAAPESGEMMANGKPYPEGSMVMKPAQ